MEHIPDFAEACTQIRRALVPGGMHIFTIPVVTDRTTRKRADVVGGDLIHRLSPSYHGPPGDISTDRLVFYEFGADVVRMIEACGFSVRHYQDSLNPALNTFATIK